jgi:hypothetical protein
MIASPCAGRDAARQTIAPQWSSTLTLPHDGGGNRKSPQAMASLRQRFALWYFRSTDEIHDGSQESASPLAFSDRWSRYSVLSRPARLDSSYPRLDI